MEYLRSKREEWSSALGILRDNEYRTGFAAGLHVHVSTSAFGELGSEQDFNLTKCILIVERFWSTFETLARRPANGWSRPLTQTNPHRIEDVVKAHKGRGSDHGVAVNIGPAATVEFRLFRSTLNPTKLFGCLELVAALVSSARTLTLKDILAAEDLRSLLTRGCYGRLHPALESYMQLVGV